jgi:hypothetical protein
MTKFRTPAIAVAVAVTVGSCAGLNLANLLQPPTFSVDQTRSAELRVVPPSAQSPLGGAGIRLWAHVHNPNAFGLALTALEGTLALEGTRAANVNFPLGVPLVARADTVIPLDITVRFSDLPGLADVAARLLTQSSLRYQLDGTVTVDAGALARDAKFGPSTLLRGDLVVRR